MEKLEYLDSKRIVELANEIDSLKPTKGANKDEINTLKANAAFLRKIAAEYDALRASRAATSACEAVDSWQWLSVPAEQRDRAHEFLLKQHSAKLRQASKAVGDNILESGEAIRAEARRRS